MTGARRGHHCLAVVLLTLWNYGYAFAGPPFRTDDPDPVPWHHYEAYAFLTYDRAAGSGLWAVPAFEFNVGAARNLQLHVVIPAAYVTPRGNYGLGDLELGAKYLFVKETGKRPEVGVFPLIEVPTGNAKRGLGNGQLWARLPVWVQKSAGPWTTYGGVGYEVNHAAGMKSSLFAGGLLQREITKRLILGAELYYQDAQVVAGRGGTYLDGGGYYNVHEDLSLLFMVGHTVAGERRTTAYAGLYYTWGHKRATRSTAAAPRLPHLGACSSQVGQLGPLAGDRLPGAGSSF